MYISKLNRLSHWKFCDRVFALVHKARIFLLVDLREIFFRPRVGGTKKINKKALEMTS